MRCDVSTEVEVNVICNKCGDDIEISCADYSRRTEVMEVYIESCSKCKNQSKDLLQKCLPYLPIHLKAEIERVIK
jgi:hypothetical protein